MSEIEGFDAHLEARVTRARAVVSAVQDHLVTLAYEDPYTEAETRDVVAVCLDSLEQQFRDHADRVTIARKKGHTGIARELLRVAEEVAGFNVYVKRLEFDDDVNLPGVTTIPEIVTLDQREPGKALDAVAGELPDVDPGPEVDPEALETIKAYLRGDTDDLPHAIIAPDGSTELISEDEARELYGDILLPDVDPGPEVDPEALETIKAYLRGETNDLPDGVVDNLPNTIIGADGSPEPISKEESLAMTYGIPLPDVYPKIVTPTPTRPSIDDFFAGVTPPAYDGPRLTLAELRKPCALPPEADRHLSVSSISDYVECGLKFRLTRREIGIPELPAWWNVGGNAFHAAIERLEIQAAFHGWGSPIVEDMCDGVKISDAPWMRYLHAEIERVKEDSGVDPKLWRAAKGGKEAYDWWRVEGWDMLRRYINQRDPNRHIVTLSYATPAIEQEFTLDVEGVPVKGFVDSVWYANAPDAIMIDDLKAGASKPGDTFQLGVYAHAILDQLREAGREDTKRVFGRYYMARTGEYTSAVNLLEAHPWDEIVYRVHQVDRADRAGIYPARTSGLGGGPCGTCGTKLACPIGGK